MNLELLSDILGYSGIGSSTLPILSFFFSKKKNRLIFLLVLEIFVVNFSTLLLYVFTQCNQNYLIFAHVFISGWLLLLLFKIWSKQNKTLINIILTINFFSFLNFIFDDNLDLSLSYYSTIMNICFSILAIVGILQTYKYSTEISLFADRLFILSAAILLYCGLQNYVLIFESIIRSNQDQLFYYTWPIVQISSILYYILISLSIWKSKT